MFSNLNDEFKIDSIMKDDILILEPLYWLLEDSIYENNLSLAKNVYFDFLYFAKYRKKDLINALKPAYIKRLKIIAQELFDGKYLKEQKSVIIKPATKSTNIPFQKESDLRDYLASNVHLLSEVLQDNIKTIEVEVKTDGDFKCDILVSSENFHYPIELKIKQANHAVVSQIAKYCHYFHRKFRYDFHKPIQGVVCANGFDVWSINELRRDGIICLDISEDGRLRKIESDLKNPSSRDLDINIHKHSI